MANGSFSFNFAAPGQDQSALQQLAQLLQMRQQQGAGENVQTPDMQAGGAGIPPLPQSQFGDMLGKMMANQTSAQPAVGAQGGTADLFGSTHIGKIAKLLGFI